MKRGATTVRLDTVILWLVGTLCLVVTTTVGVQVTSRVATGPSRFTQYWDSWNPAHKQVRVVAESGADVVVHSTPVSNVYIEASYWIDGPLIDMDDAADSPDAVLRVGCATSGLQLPRRLCHVAVNLQVPPGTTVEGEEVHGGRIRAGSPDVKVVPFGG